MIRQTIEKKIIALVIGLFFLLLFLNPIQTHAIYEDTIPNQSAQYDPNSVIVKFKADQAPTDLQAQVAAEQSSILKKLEALPKNFLSHITGDQTPQQRLQNLTNLDSQNGVKVKTTVDIFNDETFLYKTDGTKSVNDIVAQYTSQPGVEYAEPNYIYHALSVPNDTNFNKMWSLAKIRMPEAWDASTGSKSVLVADIDSGIDNTHPDLKDNIVEVKSFVSCGGGDQVGHGTHTAGTIGAVGNNGQGVTGINWHVGLLALKVGCGESMTLASITSAINYASSRGAKAINMSLGGSGTSQTMATTIKNAVNAGTVVVVAAGNTPGPYADSFYPASDPNVITVSATGPNDEFAHYSSYGNSIDVAAPGGNPSGGSSTCTSATCILSTWPTTFSTGYASITGTSMAAPHVTGLVALMFAKDSTLTPDRVKKILESTAVDLGTPGRDNKFGAGRIDAKAALDTISGTVSITPTSFPTAIPTIPKLSPTPIISQPNGADQGDYDGNKKIDIYDFEAWRKDYLIGKSSLKYFNIWRRAYFAN